MDSITFYFYIKRTKTLGLFIFFVSTNPFRSTGIHLIGVSSVTPVVRNSRILGIINLFLDNKFNAGQKENVKLQQVSPWCHNPTHKLEFTCRCWIAKHPSRTFGDDIYFSKSTDVWRPTSI